MLWTPGNSQSPWSPGESGGGGGGDVDFIEKSMSGAQGSISTGTVIAFDTVERSRGDLGGAGNQFTGLKAGRTYLLIAQYRTTSGSFTALNWYDVTGAAYLSTQGGVGLAQSTIITHQIWTPSADSILEVRAQLTSGTETTDGFGANATVTEIGAGR